MPVPRKTRTVRNARARIACASLAAILWTLLLAWPKMIGQLFLDPSSKSRYSEVLQWSMLARAFIALVCTATYSESLLSFLQKGKQHELSCALPLGKRRVSLMNVALLSTTLVFAGFNVSACVGDILGQQRRHNVKFALDCVLLLSETLSTLLVCFIIFQHERMVRAAMVVLTDYAEAEYIAACGFVEGQIDTW
ncbi:hypothetical protein MRX96_054143 [Rhipicephalus microplus]